MMNNINRKSTIAKAKQYLSEYPLWAAQDKMYESMQTSSYQCLPTMGISDKDVARAHLELAIRKQTLDSMAGVNDYYALLTEVLTLRYVECFQIKKVCEVLAKDFDLEMKLLTVNIHNPSTGYNQTVNNF